MKKITLILVLIQTTFMLSCTQKNEEITDIKTDDLITMENLDEYMFRDDVQYVDLRNFEARFADGFIYSFEVIPFFDYLDNRAFIRNDGYNFQPEQLLSENEFLRLFDKNKSIFLYADGCIRSGYIKDILNYLGYEKVFVLGGYFEYDGEHKVLGDDYFKFGNSFSNRYYNSDTELTYYIYGGFNMDRKINSVRFDIVDKYGVSLRTPNYSEDFDYNYQFKNLEDYIKSDIVTFKELKYSFHDDQNENYKSLLNFDRLIFDDLMLLIEPLVPK